MSEKHYTGGFSRALVHVVEKHDDHQTTEISGLVVIVLLSRRNVNTEVFSAGGSEQYQVDNTVAQRFQRHLPT